MSNIVGFWLAPCRCGINRHAEKWRASVATGAPFESEVRYRGVDGQYRWFLTRAVPLRDARGKIGRWYGSSTDIEDRKRAEQLQADLAHINRVTTMGELTASLAHEIKQPIGATIINAEICLQWLARDRPDLDEMRNAASSIVKDGKRAGDVIDRIRSLYKKAPPQRQLVDVNEIKRNHPRNSCAAAGRGQPVRGFDAYRSSARSFQDHRRPCATSAGVHEPDAQRHRSDEGDRGSTYGQVATGPGRWTADLS